MNIPIIIPLGAGSRQQDAELKYCLRSIVKFLDNYSEIIIVGEKPSWIQNVVHISMQEDTAGSQRAKNIYRKIERGIRDIEGDFLFFNDDHFLLAPFDAESLPYFRRGPVDLVRSATWNMPQYHQEKNTQLLFEKTVIDFDVHCPILYNKARFLRIFEHLVWPDYGFLIKSTYCNRLNIDGVMCEDLKFRQAYCRGELMAMLDGRQWFSTGDAVLHGGDLMAVLEELYPEKSIYEK